MKGKLIKEKNETFTPIEKIREAYEEFKKKVESNNEEKKDEEDPLDIAIKEVRKSMNKFPGRTAKDFED